MPTTYNKNYKNLEEEEGEGEEEEEERNKLYTLHKLPTIRPFTLSIILNYFQEIRTCIMYLCILLFFQSQIHK